MYLHEFAAIILYCDPQHCLRAEIRNSDIGAFRYLNAALHQINKIENCAHFVRMTRRNKNNEYINVLTLFRIQIYAFGFICSVLLIWLHSFRSFIQLNSFGFIHPTPFIQLQSYLAVFKWLYSFGFIPLAPFLWLHFFGFIRLD